MLEDVVGVCGLLLASFPKYAISPPILDLNHCFLETNSTNVYPKGSNIYLVSDRKGSDAPPTPSLLYMHGNGSNIVVI